jgi:hypothetical protein
MLKNSRILPHIKCVQNKVSSNAKFMLTYNYVAFDVNCTQKMKISQCTMKNPMFAELAFVFVYAALCLSFIDLGLLVSSLWCYVALDIMDSEDYRKRKPQL